MTITREKFIAATGVEPQDDDLDRCNCDKAGQVGHFCCGWDYDGNRPRFQGNFLVPIAGQKVTPPAGPHDRIASDEEIARLAALSLESPSS